MKTNQDKDDDFGRVQDSETKGQHAINDDFSRAADKSEAAKNEQPVVEVKTEKVQNIKKGIIFALMN